MVRLKEYVPEDIYPNIYDFNSSMVRLKEINTIAISPQVKIFQFQYGAIESVVPSSTIFSHPHFNSSMVRLKDRCFRCSGIL